MKNSIHFLREFWYKNISKPLFTAFLITIITLGIVLLVLSQWKPNHYEYFTDELLSHIIGVFFDVVIVVFLFALINSMTEKRQRIERYKEEIDDFRTWNDPEATHRLRGLIKRMNKEGKTKLSLADSRLQEADLSKADLTKANLSKANLFRANLYKAMLSEADLSGANLSGANLSGANLSGANLRRANLSESMVSDANLSGVTFYKADLSMAYLFWANLSNSDLSEADLSGTDLSMADLSKADLSKANLSGTNLSKANLSKAGLEYFQLKFVIFLKGTTMMDGTPYDESWAKRIAESEVPPGY
jgi:hypothetical protein